MFCDHAFLFQRPQEQLEKNFNISHFIKVQKTNRMPNSVRLGTSYHTLNQTLLSKMDDAHNDFKSHKDESDEVEVARDFRKNQLSKYIGRIKRSVLHFKQLI